MALGSMARRSSWRLPLGRNGRNSGPSRSAPWAGEIEIGAQPRCGLRAEGERVATAARAHHPPRVIAAVLVQIADLEGRDLGTPQSYLQADREQRAIAQAGDGILGRGVQHL